MNFGNIHTLCKLRVGTSCSSVKVKGQSPITERPTVRREATMRASGEVTTTVEDRLGALQSHFTWDLDPSRSKLLRVRDKLQDIGTEEGYAWLGHIYNLQGYVHLQLGQTREARRFLSRAAEALRQIRNTVSDEGPWLLVNYGNRAWLHHLQGEEAESRDFLAKIDGLTAEYPSPSADRPHPEVCAERAWTLMKFGREGKLLAASFFQTAVQMQPEVVEWRSSQVLLLADTFKQSQPPPDVLEKMRVAKDHDPENLYLAAVYLQARAMTGQKVEDEARALARRVLQKPVSSYSGLKPLLRLLAIHVSTDEAIDLAEGALERHPEQRYLKRCAAVCYKMKLVLDRDAALEHSVEDRAVSLYREVIALYPDSSLKRKISLANIYAQSRHGAAAAEEVYAQLLAERLDPKDAQMLYNSYAKHLHSIQRESHRSIEFHMRAAEIPQPSLYRDSSLGILRRIRDRDRNRMCRHIRDFLANVD